MSDTKKNHTNVLRIKPFRAPTVMTPNTTRAQFESKNLVTTRATSPSIRGVRELYDGGPISRL